MPEMVKSRKVMGHRPEAVKSRKVTARRLEAVEDQKAAGRRWKIAKIRKEIIHHRREVQSAEHLKVFMLWKWKPD